MNDHLEFPFLFGGTFIEAREDGSFTLMALDFPSFSEGLSLRRCDLAKASGHSFRFPFLFGGTFIEAGCLVQVWIFLGVYFPSFSEGLSLRLFGVDNTDVCGVISLPFRRDFH